MKKDSLVIFSILIACFSLIIYYTIQTYNTNNTAIIDNDNKEIQYIAFEIKRSKVETAIKLIEDKKFDEALIILERFKENNPFLYFYRGLALYNLGKRTEGLNLIKLAIQSAPILYDQKYKNNVRPHLENILNQIKKEENLKSYRHLFESKLKGGCG